MAKKENKAASKWTEDWIPVKGIMNGMIQLENGEYVTGVKVQPKNILIQDESSQYNAIFQLQNCYNNMNFEFWLIVADRPVDINVYLSQLQIQYNNAQEAVTRKLIQEDIDKANRFASYEYNIVDTEYYLIFKEKKMEVIQKRLSQMISDLANAGIQAQQTSNNDLRVVIDNFFNGGEAYTYSGMVGA